MPVRNFLIHLALTVAVGAVAGTGAVAQEKILDHLQSRARSIEEMVGQERQEVLRLETLVAKAKRAGDTATQERQTRQLEEARKRLGELRQLHEQLGLLRHNLSPDGGPVVPPVAWPQADERPPPGSLLPSSPTTAEFPNPATAARYHLLQAAAQLRAAGQAELADAVAALERCASAPPAEAGLKTEADQLRTMILEMRGQLDALRKEVAHLHGAQRTGTAR